MITDAMYEMAKMLVSVKFGGAANQGWPLFYALVSRGVRRHRGRRFGQI